MRFSKFAGQFGLVLSTSLILTSAILAEEVTCFEEFSNSICKMSAGGAKICGPQYAENQFYIDKLEIVFSFSPEISKKLMCSLSEIVIVDELGKAAGRYTGETETVELLAELFAESASVDLYLMGEVYMYFETDEQSYEWINADQLVDRQLIFAPEGRLYYLVTHELGHHLDYKHTLGSGFSCLYAQEQNNIYSAPFGQEIREIRDIGGHELPADAAVTFYKWLNGSPFVSPYSITADVEDFAETYSYYILFHMTSAFMQIVADGKETFSTRSSGFTESKARKFATLEYLIDAVLMGDESIGLKMVTCELAVLND